MLIFDFFYFIQRFELAEKFVLLLATNNQIEGKGDVIVNIEYILKLNHECIIIV